MFRLELSLICFGGLDQCLPGHFGFAVEPFDLLGMLQLQPLQSDPMQVIVAGRNAKRFFVRLRPGARPKIRAARQ